MFQFNQRPKNRLDKEMFFSNQNRVAAIVTGVDANFFMLSSLAELDIIFYMCARLF